MATFASDGSQADVITQIGLASPGDTVTVPSGSFTWGAGNTYININKSISLIGSGSGTIITLASDAPSGANASIRLNADGIVVSSMRIEPSASRTAFAIGTYSDWRITDITYNTSVTAGGYFAIITGGYGLIDQSEITGGSGSNELIFVRGPTDSWQTAASLGAADSVYIENNTFNGLGYVCDANANSRVVVRFNTISERMKADGHGLASNTPARGVRHMEVYENDWTYSTSDYWTAIEVRGGSGIVFNNTSTGDYHRAWFYLTDYGYLASSPWSNFGLHQNPNNYPIGDQIGTGQDVTVNATDIEQYKMYRIATIGTTDFTAVGASTNTVGLQFIATSGPGTGTGTATTAPSSEPVYVFNNLQNGAAWPRSVKTPSANAITYYGSSFIERDLVQKDRDFFADSGFDGTFTFDGTIGVGRGTAAQMAAITPTTTGVGFWVTDEGDWNTELSAGTSGRLYTWDGAAWVLYYTPYTYPHPLTGGSGPITDTDPPTPNPATIASAVANGPFGAIITATTASDATGVGSYEFSVVPTGDATSWDYLQVDPTLQATGLLPSTTYDCRVRVYDTLGNVTTQSAISTVTTAALPKARHRGVRGSRY